MPIYAYKCSTCGHAKDVLQKISAAPLTDCPECGASTFTKQVTAAGFQLKGSGWYVTDFRNNGSGGAAAAKPKGEGESAAAPAAEGAAASSSGSASTAPAAPAAGAAKPAAAPPAAASPPATS